MPLFASKPELRGARGVVLCGLVVGVLAGCREVAAHGGSAHEETQRSAWPGTAHDPGSSGSPPTAILVDAEQDVYLVAYQDEDRGGRVARFEPDPRRVDEHWIESDAILRAPSGLAVSKDILFISDRTALRRFDRQSGRYRGSVEIPGATCLEGVAADLRGHAYLVDSGMSPCDRRETIERKIVKPGAVYRVDPSDEVTTLLAGEDLHQPRAIVYRDGRLWVSTSGANEVFAIDGTRQKTMPLALPAGALAGIVAMSGEQFLVASGEGQCVYRGSHDSPMECVASVVGPASLAYDTRRQRMLVAESSGLHSYPVPLVATGPSDRQFLVSPPARIERGSGETFER